MASPMRKHASFSVYSHQNTVLFTPRARQGSAGTGSHENARFGIAGAAQTTPNAPPTPLTLMWRADTPPCKFTDAHGPLRHLAPTAVTRPCHVAQGLKKRRQGRRQPRGRGGGGVRVPYGRFQVGPTLVPRTPPPSLKCWAHRSPHTGLKGGWRVSGSSGGGKSCARCSLATVPR